MDGLKLINPAFDIEFADKKYTVRKANLERVILFQKRMVELVEEKDTSIDMKGAAYCLYLTLHAVDESVTEQFISENAPGDLDPYDLFEQLGFMNRQKVEMMKRLMQGARNAPDQKAPGQTGE